MSKDNTDSDKDDTSNNSSVEITSDDDDTEYSTGTDEISDQEEDEHSSDNDDQEIKSNSKYKAYIKRKKLFFENRNKEIHKLCKRYSELGSFDITLPSFDYLNEIQKAVSYKLVKPKKSLYLKDKARINYVNSQKKRKNDQNGGDDNGEDDDDDNRVTSSVYTTRFGVTVGDDKTMPSVESYYRENTYTRHPLSTINLYERNVEKKCGVDTLLTIGIVQQQYMVQMIKNIHQQQQKQQQQQQGSGSGVGGGNHDE